MTASLIRPNEVDLGTGKVDYNFTSTMEIAESMFFHQKANLNFLSNDSLQYKYRQESIAKFTELAGATPYMVGGRTRAQTADFAKMDKIIEQNRLEGKEGWGDVATTYEIQEKAISEAQQKKIAYDESMMRAAPDAHPMVGTLAGGITGWMADPVQGIATLLTLPITAPARVASMGRAAWVARAATVEAGVNAAMEVPFQIAVKDWQNTVGHEYGWDDAALNVAFAAAAGFVTSGVVNTATRGWRRMEMTRMGDASTNVAHDENMDLLAKAFDEGAYTGKMPEIKLNPKAAARKFENGAATQEEVSVVREFRGMDADEKNLDGFAKRKFIEAKREEYLVDSQLTRGDVKELQESFLQARDSIQPMLKEVQTIKAQLDEVTARGNKIIDQFGEASPEAKLVIEEGKKITAQLSKKEAAVKASMTRAQNLQAKLRTSQMADAADRHLKELDSGKIPAHLSKKFTQYKKNIKEALEVQKEWEAEVRNHADNLLTRPVMSEADSIAKMVESPDYAKAVDRSFETTVADSLTDDVGKFDYIDENGGVKSMTMSEIADEIKAEKTYLQRILSCAWGGK
jgi:hypothetical protein